MNDATVSPLAALVLGAKNPGSHEIDTGTSVPRTIAPFVSGSSVNVPAGGGAYGMHGDGSQRRQKIDSLRSWQSGPQRVSKLISAEQLTRPGPCTAR